MGGMGGRGGCNSPRVRPPSQNHFKMVSQFQSNPRFYRNAVWNANPWLGGPPIVTRFPYYPVRAFWSDKCRKRVQEATVKIALGCGNKADYYLAMRAGKCDLLAIRWEQQRKARFQRLMWEMQAFHALKLW